MKATKNVGIDISQQDGIPLSSGNEFYWDAGLAEIIMAEAGEFCPNADFQQKDSTAFSTRFHKDNKNGREVCGRSESLEMPKVRVPEVDLDKFIAALDRLHTKADGAGVPSENRMFIRNFVVPNPLLMKSAWRVTNEFSKKLLVLWGYTTSSYSDVVLPLTPTSAKWDDAAQRTDLKKMFADNGLLTKHKFNWGKLFSRLLLILLLILLLAVLCAALANGTNGSAGTSQEAAAGACVPPGDNADCINDRAAVAGKSVAPSRPEDARDGRSNEPGNDSANSPLKDDGAEPDSASAVSGGSEKINGDNANSAGDIREEAGESAGVDRSLNGGSEDNGIADGGMTNGGTDSAGVDAGGIPDGVAPGSDDNGIADGGTDSVGVEAGGIPDGVAPGSEDNGIADGGMTNGGTDSAVAGGSEKTQTRAKRAAFEFSVVPEHVSRKIFGLGKGYEGAFKVIRVANGRPEEIRYEVKNWRVNGNVEKENGTLFTCSLRQDKRYVIVADVFVDGVKQRVNPYRWNCIDEPVWRIARVGNSDGKYQVLCVNASNVDFGVSAWDDPVFKDAGLNDITRKFSRINKLNRSEDGRIVELSWSQEHMGEYIMELKATVETRPGYGREAKRTKVSNSFALLNGARTEGLVSGKIANATRAVYCCMTKDTDGNLRNGTAFAVSDKYLLTNYHVAVGAIPEYYGRKENYRIDASKPFVLSNENEKIYARVLDSDKSTDLALLVICDKNGKDTGEKLPQFFIIDNGGPELGEKVFSLGYPAGTSENDKPAFTTGKIEGTVNAPGDSVMIRHFSDIQPGYSGGPLVYMDKDDVVAGVNASGRFSDDNELKGANYAVSAAEIRKRFPVIFSGGAAE